VRETKVRDGNIINISEKYLNDTVPDGDDKPYFSVRKPSNCSIYLGVTNKNT
jgi:hypothetical protein